MISIITLIHCTVFLVYLLLFIYLTTLCYIIMLLVSFLCLSSILHTLSLVHLQIQLVSIKISKLSSMVQTMVIKIIHHTSQVHVVSNIQRFTLYVMSFPITFVDLFIIVVIIQNISIKVSTFLIKRSMQYQYTFTHTFFLSFEYTFQFSVGSIIYLLITGLSYVTAISFI